jgi:carbamoyl-phosphate synthase large subunit
MVDSSYEGFEALFPIHDEEALHDFLTRPTDMRLFAIAFAMIHKNYSVEKLHDLTKIDKWFLYKLENIVKMKKQLETCTVEELPESLLKKAKQLGFSDNQIGTCVGGKELEIRQLRKDHGIIPYVKRIDTLASEFPASTNYLYTTYNGSTHDVEFKDQGIAVLGSGVYRIGSSVEFDWCGVSCIRSLRDQGYKTIMINYNPETVSTDFDECDRLYFEEISLERTLDIYELEQASGCVVSVGGQLPQNIALDLFESGANVLGTPPPMLDSCEDRDKFSRILDELGIDQPDWKRLTTAQEAIEFAETVGYRF